jgi:hypothetical protein
MTEQPYYDPNSLADHLDEVLPPGGRDVPAGDPDPLVEAAALLSSAPKFALSPEALARIQTQVMAAHSAMPEPAPRPFGARLPLLMGGAAVIVVAIVVILVSKGMPSVIVPTATNQPSITPAITATQTATATPRSTPTATQTANAAPTSEATSSPALTPTPTALPISLVIEGPVEAINGNVVTIYGVEVEFPVDAPILKVIHIGDTVRVEGSTVSTTVVAVNTTIDNADVAVNSQSGAVWRDSGDCSNPPPDWAPANGWRRRCQGGANPGSSNPGQPGNGNKNSNKGMGKGKDG